MLTLIVGMVTLPFLLRSWYRTGNDEDAALALGIIGCLMVTGSLAATLFFFPPL